MTTDRPRDIKVDLDIISRGLLQVTLILLRQPFQFSPASSAHLADHQFPSSAPPTVGNALVNALTELALFCSLYPPQKNVSTGVSNGGLQHAGPFQSPLDLLFRARGNDLLFKWGRSWGRVGS